MQKQIVKRDSAALTLAIVAGSGDGCGRGVRERSRWRYADHAGRCRHRHALAQPGWCARGHGNVLPRGSPWCQAGRKSCGSASFNTAFFSFSFILVRVPNRFPIFGGGKEGKHKSSTREEKTRSKTCSTWPSPVVPDPTTTQARGSLTSLFGWEAVTLPDMAACNTCCAKIAICIHVLVTMQCVPPPT